MKNILIIGIDRFGYYLCKEFSKLNIMTVAIDVDEQKLEKVDKLVSKTIIGDSTDIEFVKTIGVDTFDECIVCIGTDFQNSLETVLNLKDLGAKKVTVRAIRESQETLLKRLGADLIIFPEKQQAKILALNSGVNCIYDFMELEDNFGLYESTIPEKWDGKEIGDIRKEYDVSIICYKIGNKTKIVPGSHFIIDKKGQDNIVILGTEENMAKLYTKEWFK